MIEIDSLAISGGTTFVCVWIKECLSTDPLFVYVSNTDTTAPTLFIFISIFPFIENHISGQQGQIQKGVIVAIKLIGGLNGMKRGQITPFVLFKSKIGVQMFFSEIVDKGIEVHLVCTVRFFGFHIDLSTDTFIALQYTVGPFGNVNVIYQ